MSEWKECLFHEAVMFPPKITLEKEKEYSFIPMEDINGTTKYVTPKNIKKWLGTGGAKFEEGDTLFARITPCLQNGKIAQAKNLINGKGFGSTEYFIFRGKENVSDTDFVYYLSQTEDFRKYAIGSMVGASGRQRADATFVGNYPILLPPLPTQQRIASILSAYDDLIENNLKRIKLLEEIAQRTYEEWFVKFRINGVQLEVSENGLPEGWEKKKFSECLNFKTGKLDSNAMIENGMFDFYTCSKEIYKTNTYCFEGEAILLGGNNATGNFSLFYANSKFDAYQRTYIITSKYKVIPLVYVYYVLKNLLPQFQNVSSGAATKFLTMRILDLTEIIIPIEKYLISYFEKVKLNFDKIINLQNQNRLLKESRDILLPRLMSVKVGV